MVLWLLLSACSDSKDDSGEGTADGGETSITGEIDFSDLGMVGSVHVQKAYGWQQSGTLVVYLSSHPSASCEQIAAYLAPADEPYDPNPQWISGACDYYLRFPGWSGSLTATDDSIVIASTALNCALGDGSFELGVSGGEEDYYWSGHWWQGVPTRYSLDVADSTSDAGGYELTLSMNTYHGNLIYESFSESPGSGTVSGSVHVEPCSAFSAFMAR